MSTPALSRRQFLKGIGVGTGAALASQLLVAPSAHASEANADETWAVLVDLTRCVGCNSCTLACKESNTLPNADTPPDALSSEAYTFVDTPQFANANGEMDERHVKRQCMHCVDPACVSACPAAAMYKSEEGPVVYRSERCLGCRYCQMACPFDVPSFEWDNGVTPVISKCWMCVDKLQAGDVPACVGACPNGALRFGNRKALLAQAHAQIESNPGRYIDHIFGEHEVGGTSMLYLSDVPFEKMGFPAGLPDTPPPQETEKIMNTLPAVITGTTALMAGVAYFAHRRQAHKLAIKDEET